MNKRWKKLLLVAVSLLLVILSLAAAAVAMRFELAAKAQDPVQEEIKEKKRSDDTAREARTVDEFKERMARDPNFRKEVQRKQEVEMEMRELKHAALVHLSRVTMDQAIQIASSQNPGKVLVCNLDGDKWEEPGKLAKDGVIFYHVVMANEGTPGATHVWVNAVDGSIIKTEKEIPRKRSPENVNP